MVKWLKWHCPPDTGFEIWALAVWGRARYLSVTEAPHNTEFHTWMGKKHFSFFQTAETGNRTPDSSVKGSSANHYHRAPAHVWLESVPTFQRRPSKQETFNQCWLSVGPVSQVTDQYWVDIGLIYRVSWGGWQDCGVKYHRTDNAKHTTRLLIPCLSSTSVYSARQRQTTVIVYFPSKQLLVFAFSVF